MLRQLHGVGTRPGLERVGGRAVRDACHVHVGELGVNLRR